MACFDNTWKCLAKLTILVTKSTEFALKIPFSNWELPFIPSVSTFWAFNINRLPDAERSTELLRLLRRHRHLVRSR